jgi:hypothetical protein
MTPSSIFSSATERRAQRNHLVLHALAGGHDGVALLVRILFQGGGAHDGTIELIELRAHLEHGGVDVLAAGHEHAARSVEEHAVQGCDARGEALLDHGEGGFDIRDDYHTLKVCDQVRGDLRVTVNQFTCQADDLVACGARSSTHELVGEQNLHAARFTAAV